MSDTALGYDGLQFIRGCWGGNPETVPDGYCHRSNNRFFREDYNLTRPSIVNIVLEFESDAQRIWFEGANGQGATFYNSYPSYLTPHLVCSLGGRIFIIDVQGRRGIVKQLFDGNSRQFQHSWFAQGFQWLVIQDGINAPILWDGVNPARRSDLTKNEVPTGSVMAFIHGRFVVASADGNNAIFVGDIAYGDTVTNPNNILNFTERTYWAEGGNFNTPTFIGNIMGLYPMPFLDTGTGQNELVVGCVGGFSSLDLSAPRTDWINTQVQRVALIGDGLVSSHGYAGLNGDMFFRGESGINTYRNARIEYSQGYNQTPVSREVKNWLVNDRRDLLEFIPMVSFQNMVICGVSPFLAPPNNPGFGLHRYCRGMVVFDADSMSTAGRTGSPVWHGMWSGIRPWAFAEGQVSNALSQCFAFSYDRDGRNRLYEITLNQGDDVFGATTPRKIQGFFTSGLLGSVEEVTNSFKPKIIDGGVIEFSQVLGASEFTIDYRPDGSPCWVEIDSGTPGCDCPTRIGDCPPVTAQPQWGRKYLQQLKRGTCLPGSPQTAPEFHHCQVRVRTFGSFNINRLNIRFQQIPDSQVAKCLGPQCDPIDCCPDADDYAYHIAPTGTNDEVPVIPEVPGVTYVSTRLFRAVCPSDPTISVIATGQATSVISQLDADQKATVAAEQNAYAMLVCPQCQTQVLDDFFIDGGSEDLSSFFTPGLLAGSEGQPIRLVDVLTDQQVMLGIVDSTGTLVCEMTFASYAIGTFDCTTHIYDDSGGGHTRIQLQVGCMLSTGYFWPPTEPYYT